VENDIKTAIRNFTTLERELYAVEQGKFYGLWPRKMGRHGVNCETPSGYMMCWYDFEGRRFYKVVNEETIIKVAVKLPTLDYAACCRNMLQ
jgi:hypothetical protein